MVSNLLVSPKVSMVEPCNEMTVRDKSMPAYRTQLILQSRDQLAVFFLNLKTLATENSSVLLFWYVL